MDKVFLRRMKCHYVKLADVPPAGPRTNPHIATHEITMKLVPFSNKLFQEVNHRKRSLSTEMAYIASRSAAFYYAQVRTARSTAPMRLVIAVAPPGHGALRICPVPRLFVWPNPSRITAVL